MMGGTSKTSQTQTQKSTTAPWEAAQPALQGILSQINGGLNNTGVTGAESAAIDNYVSSANRGNPFSGQIGNLATDLLNGGGATGQTGNVNQAYQDYVRRLSPTADGQNIGPDGNPALQKYLNVASNDIQSRINGMFAGAGRDLSGANVIQTARGVMEGTAPILASQYNTDVNNQRSAADALYGAGNNTAGILSGMNQQALANRGAGAGVANQQFDQNLSGAKAWMEGEAMRRGIPLQTLGLLANIGIPIAGLGSQSTGTSNTQGQHQMSGAQQFGLIAQGANSILNPTKWLFGGA